MPSNVPLDCKTKKTEIKTTVIKGISFNHTHKITSRRLFFCGNRSHKITSRSQCMWLLKAFKGFFEITQEKVIFGKTVLCTVSVMWLFFFIYLK